MKVDNLYETSLGRSFEEYDYHLINLDSDITRYPYELESLFLHYVSEGNYDEAIKIYDRVLQKPLDHVGTFAVSERKQLEYTAVAMIAFFSRAAMSSGMEPLIAYDKSDIYLMRISECSDPLKQLEIVREALHDFCRLVADFKKQHTMSLHVRNCKEYIYQHLNTACAISDIAAYLHLNPYYLSKLFHQNEGLTLKDFILNEKLNAAKNMLKYSDYTMSVISERFAFTSQTYFAYVFKKKTGMTPSQYRMRFKPISFKSL